MIEVRRYRPQDAAHLGKAPDTPCWGLTATQDGAVKALGGFIESGGHFFAFYHRDAGFGRGVALHRIVRAAMKDAAAHGILPIFVLRDSAYPTSARWLTLLGFRRITEEERDGILTFMEQHSGFEAWGYHG